MMVKATLIALLAVLGAARNAGADSTPRTVAPLSKEWAPLGMITNLHTLVHKKSGLTIRVLEADGSGSVAEDPISLFIVATNRGTSDLREHVWRLPHGLARLKKVVASKCGVDIVGEVDVPDGEQGLSKKKAVVVKSCFIGPTGELESQLKVDDGAAAAPGQ
jgi:hypothetical protein